MVYVFIRGRLGNQLFQYAFVRSLMESNPHQKFVFSFSDVYKSGNKENGWENSLDYFNLHCFTEDNNPVVKLSVVQRFLLHFYWSKFPHKQSIETINSYQLRWLSVFNRVGLYYLDLGYFPFRKKIRGNAIISGNFESKEYFKDIEHVLKQEIVPKYPLLQSNESLWSTISTTCSVCVSIRRGDYISNDSIRSLMNVCDKSYYLRAINIIKAMVSSPVFVFFSDDISWVKENITIDDPCVYESGNDPVWEKLRLMSGCKHFIISNSTFSWWAQYLGKSKDKIVVAPYKWYNSEIKSSLYESSWILIPDE